MQIQGATTKKQAKEINKTPTKAKTGGKIESGEKQRKKNVNQQRALHYYGMETPDELINQKFYGQESLNGK